MGSCEYAIGLIDKGTMTTSGSARRCIVRVVLFPGVAMTLFRRMRDYFLRIPVLCTGARGGFPTSQQDG